MSEGETISKLMTVTQSELLAFADRLGPALQKAATELGYDPDKMTMLLAYYTGLCMGLNGFAVPVDPDMEPSPLSVVVRGYMQGHDRMRERMGLPPRGATVN